MRYEVPLIAAACCACAFPSSVAATITAVGDNRGGSISAWSGFGDPMEAGFSVRPGSGAFGPLHFDQCVVDGGGVACLALNSKFVNLGPGNVTIGFVADGTLNASKPGTNGHAISEATISIQLSVTDVPAGGSTPLTFAGSLTELGGGGSISLTGPGVSLTFADTQTWSQVIHVGNGVFTLTVDLETSLTGGATGASSAYFDLSLTGLPPIPPACAQSNSSCYLPHFPGGCEDDLCCGLVCTVDPFCCNGAWDTLCVNGTAELCSPGFASTWATDPASGHRYRLVSPETLFEAGTFLASSSANFASIDSGAENAWLREEFAAGFPGVASTNMLIGLTDYITEGFHVWTNGAPVGFTRWAPGEPDNVNDEDAVVLSGTTGTWSDVPALQNFYSIAEAFTASCGGASGSCFEAHGPNCNDESCCNEVCFADPFCCGTQWDSLCVDRALDFCNVHAVGASIVNPSTHSRYQWIGPGSWLQVSKLAKQLNGHLVMIESAAENEWLRLNFLAGQGPSDATWIGLSDQKLEGVHQWTGAVSPLFSNWGAGEPNDAGGGEDFTLMYSDGKWNDVPNEIAAYGIVEIPCAGDLDGDGGVGGSDLAILLGSWASAASAADFDLNATVDAADLAVLLGGWGPCASSNACVAHGGLGSDQPGCTSCVCGLDPFCCQVAWDEICAGEAAIQCHAACQCGG